MREQSTVRPKQTPRSAPLIGSDLGTVSPQIFSGLIVIGDATLRVGSVDRDRQGFDKRAEKAAAVFSITPAAAS